jgi:error-prone DNA polymerase
MFVEGKLERLPAAGGAINVLIDRASSIAAPDQLVAEVKDFSMLDERELARVRADAKAAAEQGAASDDTEDFRAVAPRVMSFASGAGDSRWAHRRHR